MSPYYRKLRQALGPDLLIIPSVAAVIHDDQGRLLLQEKHDGSWSLPAGAIEPGETPEAAVTREVLEETGLHCVTHRIAAVLGGQEYRHTYPNGDRVEYMIVLFHCDVSGTQSSITDLQETRRVRYFQRDQFPRLSLPYDPDLLFSPSRLAASDLSSDTA